MTPTVFRAALARLGMTQSSLARLLAEHRPDMKLSAIQRQVRRWALGETPPSAEIILALHLLEERNSQ